MLVFSFGDVDAMSGDYSLPDLIERIYANQLALEAALMELTLHAERGIDVMLTSDQRHGGARLEGRLDDLAFERQREVGAAAGSTG